MAELDVDEIERTTPGCDADAATIAALCDEVRRVRAELATLLHIEPVPGAEGMLQAHVTPTGAVVAVTLTRSAIRGVTLSNPGSGYSGPAKLAISEELQDLGGFLQERLRTPAPESEATDG